MYIINIWFGRTFIKPKTHSPARRGIDNPFGPFVGHSDSCARSDGNGLKRIDKTANVRIVFAYQSRVFRLFVLL